MINTNDPHLAQQARTEVRAMCGKSTEFLGLGEAEQYNLYKQLCRARMDELSVGQMLGTPTATVGAMPRAFVDQASDLIDDSRHQSPRIEQAGELGAGFINSIDFPQFVADLLKAVFDANLKVTLDQMDKYIELMKAASSSIGKFVNQIDDTAAFGYLAESDDEFSMDGLLGEKDDQGNPKTALTDKDGNVIATSGEDIGDNEVKTKIMDAKIAMAKEQRGMLREAVYAGLVRLVVDKGTVKANVLFDIKVDEDIAKTDRAGHRSSTSGGGGARYSSGWLGKIIGGASGGASASTKSSSISVSTASSTAATDLQVQLAGSVEIQFSSDYFKLDNFAALLEGTPAGDKATGAEAS